MATFFSTRTCVDINQKKEEMFSRGRLLAQQIMMSKSPYFEDTNHRVSALYPVVNAAHAIKNLLKIAEGILFLIPGFFIEPKSPPLVLIGIGMEVGSFVLNCLNTAVSLMTFATRTLSTIFRGYSSDNILNDFLRNGCDQVQSDQDLLKEEVNENYLIAGENDKLLEKVTFASFGEF